MGGVSAEMAQELQRGDDGGTRGHGHASIEAEGDVARPGCIRPFPSCWWSAWDMQADTQTSRRSFLKIDGSAFLGKVVLHSKALFPWVESHLPGTIDLPPHARV